MSKNYYLSKGNLKEKFDNIRLIEIYKDMKSLEEIDIYTSGFDCIDELRNELIKLGLIRSTDDICIGAYKTINGVKRLIPIYNKTIICKNDLEKLGFEGRTYDTIAQELKKYIQARSNDMKFMSYIIDNYYNKYAPKEDEDKKKKVPIYESGDISILHRILNSSTKTSRDEKDYAISFKNFLNYEIYKCEIVFEKIALTVNDLETIKRFKPIDKNINIKGLHDLLSHVINYNKNYVYDYMENINSQEIKNEQTTLDNYENEEFLETRDFYRPLKKYANKEGLDLSNYDIIEQDDYAHSFLIDEQRLVKKLDGME